MKTILVGFGIVGRSLAQVLYDNRDELLNSYRLKPKIVAVVDKGGAAIDSNGIDLDDVLKAKLTLGSVSSSKCGRPNVSAINVIKDVESDIVIEVTPTNLVDGQPGLSHIELALRKKRHVITANKGPLAVAFPMLLELAQYNNVQLRFSGTVGGGTPILDLGKGLRGNKIFAVKGILNGTTNYILTRMFESNIPMNIALKEAQEAGYAEADPTNDVEGWDSACKLVILTNWILNRSITIKDVRIEGITNINLKKIEQAKKNNSVIKLLASYDNGTSMIKPLPLPITHPLNVGGTLNAVTFSTELAGEITITGHGAGGIETAGAVLRDLLKINQTIA